MGSGAHVLGLDYGTDSVRALVVRVADGKEVCAAVSAYPRWARGLYCDPSKNQFRQHPQDYLDSLVEATRGALRGVKGLASSIAAIGIDTTGSTPVAVDRSGTALALRKDFAANPNAMFVLWKDHTAVKEADEINRLAHRRGGVDYTRYEGGIYSSEWFWAKVLHVLRADAKVRASAYSWVEHCDWLPALLTGNTDPLSLRRSRCAAGHKAMWHPEWAGLPPESFLAKLDPVLKGLRERLYSDTYTSDTPAGRLTPEWAQRLGLPAGIPVAVGAFDAHLGAVGADIQAYTMTKVMGTSTCDMVVAPVKAIGKKCVRGICGQVDGSIVPNMMGLEAGQSAFGDLYAWYKNLLLWPARHILGDAKGLSPAKRGAILQKISDHTLTELTRAAEKLAPGASGVVAVDWMNGRRTPDANQGLTGAIAGLGLGSDAPRVFRALVEATAFGAKNIVDRFEKEGVPIKQVVALGGIARKSGFVMQVSADVLGRPIHVVGSDQCCALGSAMAAAVCAGLYPDFTAAQKKMNSGVAKTYHPNPKNAKAYARLYAAYARLGAFIEGEAAHP
ncbi:MAG: ribulokinase [Spirochaetes bacterium]|nr:ribulokinase [Spirochaetota bacterium]